MTHVLLAGGTGFLGGWLLRFLQHRHPDWQFTVLTRQQRPQTPVDCNYIHWQGYETTGWTDALLTLPEVDAVINLAGRSVDCRKNPATYDEILRSRVDATQALRHVFAGRAQRPRVWLQMSTAHIYGDAPKQILNEDSSHGYGMALLSAKPGKKPSPTPLFNTAVTSSCAPALFLAPNGGPLPILTRLARCGLGGRVGIGTQGMSWLHIGDFCRLCEQALRRQHSGHL